ncbi:MULTISPECIES: flagellar filament capping protein FliD [Ramlibacter]|uniref:Flagellar hook-associated protein 2 n=1 Tax=Ramlibacter aquaticus TaxID=2780094 RepID=A0ABR9SA36_9BURK|nr:MULTISPECIES: flagellar filament capping protein FliD [Ramlibacter]MBE7939207.1 flagellar filament capping protein FliD [Ramlibacter aquaticus]
MVSSVSSSGALMSSAGIGSGLDVNSIVTALMSVEQQPLTMLQAKASTMNTEVSALGQLKSQIANLSDAANKLTTASNWNPIGATSSDTSSVDVSADNTASAGQHSVQVQQLASAQVLASGAFASSATTVGTGTLTLQLGSTAADGSFTPGAAAAVNITIGAQNNTLSGVRDAINAANAGVTASIVTSPAGAQLVLRSASGAASTVKITAADDDGNNTDANGVSALAYDPAAAAGSGRNLTQTQAGQDAKYTLDGIALTNSSNTVTGTLQGVTLTLKQVNAQPATVTTSVQTSVIQGNVNSFIGAYNALNTFLHQQTQADPTGKANGPLQGDSGALMVLNQMHQMLFGTVSGLGSPNSLSAAGISLQADGSLSLDSSKFSKASPAALQALFSQAQTGGDPNTAGMAVRFKTWAQALSGSDGGVQGELDSLARSQKDNQKQQDDLQTRLDATQARLQAQYQALDTTMSNLNAQMAQMKQALGLA